MGRFKLTKQLLKELKKMPLGARNRIMNSRAEEMRREKLERRRR